MSSAARPFCSEISREVAEPLGATASRIDHWILVEYRGLWAPHPLPDSALPKRVKAHLSAQLAARPLSRLLFVRRPDRRREPRIACFFGTTRERASEFRRLDVDSYEDLVRIDFASPSLAEGEVLAQPLLLVCTHGKRDRCCARHGRPLYDALRDQADADSVWQSTHVGGDRFAGNLVCFPEGLYFGRVGPADAWPLLDEYVAGRIDLERYRGRCCYPFPVQAAERAVREETGRRGFTDVALAGLERAGAASWRVAIEAGEDVYEVDVREEPGMLAYLTCGAETLRHPRHFVAGRPTRV